MKRILALVLCGAMLLCFAACKKDPASVDTTTDPTTSDAANDPTDDPNALDNPSDSTDPSGTEADPGNTNNPSDPSQPDVPATNDKGETTTKKADDPKAPSTQAEILSYYNNATKKAVTEKVGFYKERATNNESIEGPVQIRTVKGLIYKFIGIGEKNKYTETVEKKKWSDDAKKQYLRTSTLGASDITSAAIKESGGNYVITIKIKNGTSNAGKDGYKTNAPIEKCGINFGTEDKSYYDHKSAIVIYDAIDGEFPNATVNENYKNAVLTATVNKATGQLSALKVVFDIAAKVDLGALGAGTASGTSTVNYSSFKW